MRYCNKIYFVIISALLFASFNAVFIPSPLSANDQILFTRVLAPESYRQKWNEFVYAEAFSRLGKTFAFKSFPMKRAAMLSNKGDTDGESGRVKDFNTMYPNLIRVDFPLWKVQFSAYASVTSINVTSWDSLRNTDYRVNYQRGLKKCEEMLPKIVKADNLESVTSNIQGFEKILKGRADIYIGLESVLAPLLKTDKFSETLIRKAGILETSDIYCFLNKKHEKIVPKLEAAFRAMKNEGLFDKYDVLAAE